MNAPLLFLRLLGRRHFDQTVTLGMISTFQEIVNPSLVPETGAEP
jgi:hypothetical protein